MGYVPKQQVRGPLMELDIRTKTEVWFVGRRGQTAEILVSKNRDGTLRESESVLTIYHIQGLAAGADSRESEQIAISMCRDETYFIGPLPVNLAFPHERCEWPGMYFPLKDHDVSSS